MLTKEPLHDATLPVKLLDDVSVWLLHPRGKRSEEIYTVGSVTADRYLAVPGSKLPAVRAFMKELDGQRTLVEIQTAMLLKHGVQMDVAALHRKFGRAGLLAEAGGARGGDIEEMSSIFLRLPIDRLLACFQAAAPAIRPLALLGSALIATALVLLVADPSFLRLIAKPAATDLSRPGNVVLAVLVATVSVVLHELSHCLVASRWGILAGTVRVQLYLGTIPIVGLKLAGLYTLPPRGRLAVWSAGVFTNLSLTAAALLGMRTVAPAVALELTAAINWLLAVFNLMPLLPTDGYFVLCTLVKDSNVRVRAWDWVRRPFHKGRKRPSAFVLAYILATLGLLLNTLYHLTLRIVRAGAHNPSWQSAVSLALLALFLVTLWRTFRRTEGLE